MDFSDSIISKLFTISLTTMIVAMTPSVESHSWDFLLHSRGEDIGTVAVRMSQTYNIHNVHKRSPFAYSPHHHDDNDNNPYENNINNKNDDIDKHNDNNENIIGRRDLFKNDENLDDGDDENDDKDDDWGLPSSLTFTFNLQGYEVRLKLKKNKLLSRSSPPLYIVHDGVLVKNDDAVRRKHHDMRRGNFNKQLWGVYMDTHNGASMMISTGPSDKARYLMTGTYFRDGQEFSIRPIVGHKDGTADHVISRLFHEANLLHDVIDLDQATETSFVASMTSDEGLHNSDQTDQDDADDEDEDATNVSDQKDPKHINNTTTTVTGTTTEITSSPPAETTTGSVYNRLETVPTTATTTNHNDDNMSNYRFQNNSNNNNNNNSNNNNKDIKETISIEEASSKNETISEQGIDSKNESKISSFMDIAKTRSSIDSIIKFKISRIMEEMEKESDARLSESMPEILNTFSELDEVASNFVATDNDTDISKDDDILNSENLLNQFLDLVDELDKLNDGFDENWSSDEGEEHSVKGMESVREEITENGKVEEDGTDRHREKRQATQKYVLELLIVIDYGVYEVWYNGVTDREGVEKQDEAIRRIKQFYSFVINGVDLRYKSVNAHADYTIDVTWAGIIIFDTPDPTYWAETPKAPKASRDFVESSAALEAFRAWAERQGQALPPSDHVMLFTGHNLTYGGSVSNAGLAYLGSACNPDYFFSIVEEYFEFRDVAIAAHELGHSLGARHDMDGNTCLSFNRFIMTPRFKFPSRRKAQNPWLFSPCSVSYFTDFIQGLDKNDTNCFVTRDAEVDDAEIQPFLVSLPGEVYTGDDFCRIGSGPSSYICRSEHIQDYQTTCYRGLMCYDPAQNKCVNKLPPNGMPCGNKKWCMNGTCVGSNMAPATSGDDCPFGDDPGLVGGKTCADRMLTSRYDCYRDTFKARCCESCQKYKRNLPGCEYGDQFSLCKKDKCVNYDEDYARENCCDTCADLLFTIPTTVTTTAAPTTTPLTTTRNPEVVITVDKTGSGKGGEGESESEIEGEGEGEGQTGNGNGKGKKRVFPPEGGKTKGGWKNRRRNYVDSDESGESDEARPGYRYVSSRSYRGRGGGGGGGGERQPWTRNRQTYGRMVEIQNLLQRMRESRDDDRLQRLRLLVYLLERMAGSRLASVLLGVEEEEEDGGSVRGWDD